MRIVTRPDFDGVICAVLLHEAENITEPVKWVEPNDMQKQRVEIHPTDIIANLPYNENCRLWFDHHYTNRIDSSFTGAFRKAPSAARIIFEYYKDKFSRDFLPLVEAADRIDSAELTEDEVLHPEKYDAVILSLTISNQDEPDEAYWNRLVELLRGKEIQDVMSDPVVKKRCNDTVVQNKEYQGLLKEYTNVQGPVAVTDFRPMGKAPAGNNQANRKCPSSRDKNQSHHHKNQAHKSRRSFNSPGKHCYTKNKMKNGEAREKTRYPPNYVMKN